MRPLEAERPTSRLDVLAAWASVALVAAVIAVFSLQTPAQLHQNLRWISVIPQVGWLKLRHFPEFIPLAFLTALAVERTARQGAGRAAGLSLLAALAAGAASEFAQTFVPGRNGCALDVLSDALAALLGLAAYAALRAAAKKRPGGRLEKFSSDAPILALLLGAISLSCLPPLNWPITYEGWQLLTAFHNPGSARALYWLHVFTHWSFGPQYRPLSYFAAFYAGRWLFGNSILVYRAGGAALAFAAAAASFYLCQKISGSRLLAFAAALWFCLHPGVPALLFAISDAAKYFLPAFLLMGGMLAVYAGPGISRRAAPWLAAASALTIMAHEGAFVFPLLFIGLDWLLGRKPAWRHALLALPAFAYAVWRLAAGIPTQGIMAVSLIAAPGAVARFLSFIFLPGISGFCHPEALGFLILALMTSACGWLWWKRSERLPAFFWLCMLLLLGPFAVLKNHYLDDRALWSLALLPPLLASLYRALRARPAIHAALGFLLAAALFSNLYSTHYGLDRGLWAEQERLEALVSSRIPPSGAALKIQVVGANLWDFNMLAGFLAYHFPREAFLLTRDEGRGSLAAYVAGGTFFNERGSRWYDPLGVSARVQPPSPRRTLVIPYEFLNCLGPGPYQPPHKRG